MPHIPTTNLPIPPTRRGHSGTMVTIAIYKLLQALFFLAIGIGARRLLGRDIVDLVQNLLNDLKMDPVSGFVNWLLEKASLLNDHRLRQISLAFFCYAILDTIEGLGLLFEQKWAEYLTILITASFLPIEVMAEFHHRSIFSTFLLITNLLVVIYLVYHLRKKRP